MKFGVIGLGRFGYEVATTLSENGMEVIGVDSNELIISSIKDKVTQAISMRINDEESLRTIGFDEIDTIIVAMGENFAESILITAILKQKLKTPMVITRSISQIHRDILELIGADQVILPEQEVGQRLADILSLPFRALNRISANFSISQLVAPEQFIGKTVKDLETITEFSVRCIGKRVNGDIIPLKDTYKIKNEDILIFSGSNKSLSQLDNL